MRTQYKHAQFLQLFITVGLALAIPGFGFAQDPPRPLSIKDIRSLLEKGVQEREIINQIQRYKVDFSLNHETIEALVDAGASRGLRDTIEENPFQPLYFTFPSNGDLVGRIIRVEGWSKRFPNKHLWLFVHRKAEVNWVPQDDEVLPDSEGKWKHVIFLGEVKDSNLNFEIKAVWVDSKSHRELLSHVRSQCKKEKNERSDTCPGIRFPDGDPTALVKVIRLN